jgi:hypothetical protein
MARIYNIDASLDDVTRDLTRALQSGHLNFMIGSGASYPAIPLAGDIEAQIDTHRQTGQQAEADALLFDLIASVQAPANRLVAATPNAAETKTLDCYKTFLRTLELFLVERRTALLGKQAVLFTTNYDLFLDVAALHCDTAAVANGFDRTLTVDGLAQYSSRRFLMTTYSTGNFYDYRVELPALNLVKLHGCVTWHKDNDRITRRTAHCDIPAAGAAAPDKKTFIDRQAIVFPQSSKYNTTVLDRTYYELLRFFANTLDKENALLITFGFSFRDEHLLDVTKRALKNPTLRVLAVAYNHASRDALATTFVANNNVCILTTSDGSTIDFDRFNQVLSKSGPKAAAAV